MEANSCTPKKRDKLNRNKLLLTKIGRHCGEKRYNGYERESKYDQRKVPEKGAWKMEKNHLFVTKRPEIFDIVDQLPQAYKSNNGG